MATYPVKFINLGIIWCNEKWHKSVQEESYHWQDIAYGYALGKGFTLEEADDFVKYLISEGWV